MAGENTVDITTTYAGQAALPYIAPAILAADSIANGYITVKENVKKQLVLQKVDGTDIQGFVCDPFASSVTEDAITLTEVILAPDKLMFPMQICKADFRDTWEAEATGNGFANSQVPPSFQQFLLEYSATRNAEAIEKNIWHGDYNETDGTTTGGSAVTNFAGILARIVAGTPGYEITAANAAFTADNAALTGILTNLDAVIGNCPSAIVGSDQTKIFMSRKSLYLLQRAMAGIVTTSGGVSPTFIGDPRPTTVMGYDIIVPAGFPNDTLVIGQVANFYFGTDLTSDFSQATIVDMTTTDGSDRLRLKYQYTGGCQVGFLGDVGVARRSA
tara:strand:- start:30 stop:1019 length:990 start_codon:yes stop_codon:yes gene_type:complete